MRWAGFARCDVCGRVGDQARPPSCRRLPSPDTRGERRTKGGAAFSVAGQGSRSVQGSPAWVTLDVVHGGFAAGGFAAGGALRPHESNKQGELMAKRLDASAW